MYNLKFKDNIYPLILIVITSVLFFLNYTPGTWLSGWDTLHPEMNISEYISRIFQSVWQPHQGLGAVAAQAHASEIPRMLILIPLIILFPIEIVRWIYLLLMLILGPIGVYYLSKNLFMSKKFVNEISFISAIFYLCNLGTMQNFFAPLEMFITLYGLIGWQTLIIKKFLLNSTKNNYITLLVISFFITPIAHTPTLWFVNYLMITIFLGIKLLVNLKNIKSAVITLKKIFIILSSIIVINLYWLGPTIYFTLYHADDVSSAKITRFVSEEGILNNQEYASIQDISILKGYLYNWKIHKENEKFEPIFYNWYLFDESYSVDKIRYFLFGFIVIGILSVLWNRDKNGYAYISIMILSMFFLMMESPPLGFIFEYIQIHIPLLKEALRFPYTKFSIPLILTYSVFFGYGISHVVNILMKLLNRQYSKHLSKILIIIIFALILFQFIPAFTGNFIGKIERVNIPQSYFDLFEILNKKEESRIAIVPSNSMYGWVYYDWDTSEMIEASYQGAGFLWFLSKNPIMDREFDRWYPTNEDFYNEYSYALYSKNIDLLKYVLHKYKVNFLVFDFSLISPGSSNSLLTSEIESLLSTDSDFKLVNSFEFLKLYELVIDNNSTSMTGFYVPENYTSTNLKYSNTSVDSNYFTINKSNYIFQEPSGVEENYLFRDDNDFNMISNSKLVINEIGGNDINKLSYQIHSDEFPVEYSYVGNNLIFRPIYPLIYDSSGQKISTGGIQNEYEIGLNSFVVIEDYILVQNDNIKLLGNAEFESIYEVSSIPVYFKDYSNSIYSAEATDCLGGTGNYGKTLGNYPGSVKLEAINKNICLEFAEKESTVSNSIISVSFELRTSSGVNGLYCLRKSDGSCLNERSRTRILRNPEFTKYTDITYVTDIKEYNLSLISETIDKEIEQFVEFRNIKIEIYPVTKIFKNEIFYENSFSDIELQIDPYDFPLTVDLSVYDEFDTTYIPSEYNFNPIKKNCDSYNQKSYNREIKQILGQQYYMYSAIDAISCDTLSLPKINPSMSYTVDFDIRHESGKGIDICLYSPASQKCLVNERFKTGMHRVIYPAFKGQESLFVNIGNQSIGDVETINYFGTTSFSYIPYKFLKSLKTSDSDQNLNNIELIRSSSPYKFIYEASVSRSTETTNQNSVLILNQSFEPNWRLYNRIDCKYIPFLRIPISCSNSNYQHVLANNWANGWIVPNEDAEYIAVFWPQYLQFYGTGLLVIFIILFAVRYLFSSKYK